jgi:uncharacterized coiled-coil protein SlyX
MFSQLFAKRRRVAARSNLLGIPRYSYYSRAMDEMMIRLQTIVGHQEEEISNLSNELYTQQKELNALKQQMAVLLERFRSLPDDGAQDKGMEPPPPHY